MSLMSSLYTGVSGLAVNQRGLNATGHNLANVETKGYVRQQTLLTDSFYRNVGHTAVNTTQIGQGTTAAAIRQVRDTFLDKAYRREVGRQKYYQSQYDATVEVEEILGETEGVRFQESMKELWEEMSELAKEPDNIVERSSFIQTAVSFIERAELVYNQIEEYQLSINRQIQTYVDRINEIADKIQELNTKIHLYEASGKERANDLRDKRNVLLDELGELADITYNEDTNGVVSVILEDYPFITEDIIYYIDTREINDTTQMIEPYWPRYGSLPVFNYNPLPSSVADTDVGALKGLVLARGTKVGQYIDIPEEPKKEDFIAEDGYFFEMEYKTACAKFKLDMDYFNRTTDASTIVSVQAQFDKLVHGIVTTINDLLCPNKLVRTDDGQLIKIFDEENAPVGMDIELTPGEALFNRKSMPRYEKVMVTIEVDGIWKDVDVWKYNEEDAGNNYSLFTIGEIKVNENIMKDPSLLPLSKRGSTGDFSIDVCEELLTKWQEPFSTLTPNEYKPNNFNEFYKEMIGAMGTRGERYKSIYQSQESLVNSVENQRLAITAVSSDEELTNMIRFQQAYNASARYISVVSQMLEHLLNSLGS